MICLIIAVAACFGLVACGDTDDKEGGQNTPTINDNAWFSDQELADRGLSGFTAPQNLTGDISTTVTWFNNGYFFSQPCPSKEVFEENAKVYFEYFKDNYDGRFGVTSIKAMGVDTDETWYYITQKSELSDYSATIPALATPSITSPTTPLTKTATSLQTPYICLTSDTNLTPPRRDTF